jgi:hypothetical protein
MSLRPVNQGDQSGMPIIPIDKALKTEWGICKRLYIPPYSLISLENIFR